ncbi:MAG: SDR family oxidoreductase [Dehalococcoidia bacterium]|nr:SDR family oxidoreductase [Dehalococcoidia bacterium]
MGVQVNIDGLTGLCKAAKAQGVRRLVYASSSSVYGTQPVIATEETPPQPMTAYARTKLVGEEVANQFADDKLTVVSLRCATCCGPAPRMRLDTIVNVFSKQAYFDGTINVRGGDQYRTNIHVSDVAELYRFLLDAPAVKIQRQAFNATAGHHTALELAYMVTEVHPAKIFVDTTKRDARHYKMDGSKLKWVLGWEPKRTIRQAIEDNMAWFEAGKLTDDPNADIFYNTRRMKAVV